MRSHWPLRGKPARPNGLHYDAGFLSASARAELVAYLGTLHPLWEWRFSTVRALPEGETQRRLLRPVYWLGNWQFACLDYYRPPAVLDRAVAAERFPPVLARLVRVIEERARRLFRGTDAVPPAWHLNTCLINFYGASLVGGTRVDTARVGEHKDFEPGPVASLSLGERALFQFVTSRRPGDRDGVVAQQWLDDRSLQIFGGEQWKERTFHRVQRVDTRDGHRFAMPVPDFEVRRVNLTFRYVPDEHVQRFKDLSAQARLDVEGYVRELALHSPYFGGELAAASTA
jgi:alkylated DNA repair protein (DNA oxidative demethylase)